MYKLLSGPLGDSIKNLDTGEVFPAQAGNAAYDIYAEWVAGGGVPAAADPPASPGPAEVAQTGTKAWLSANPNAILLIDLPEAELTTQITNLVNALFPTASVANKNKEILWRMTVSMAIRVLIKQSGLG